MAIPAVPVIDLAPAERGDKRGVARAIAEACEYTGFFTIVGHRVDRDLERRMAAVSREFFDLPLEEKLAVSPPVPGPRGYAPPRIARLAYTRGHERPPDLQEGLVVGPVDVPDEPYFRSPASSLFFAPNLWPKRPAELRPIWTEYFRVMERLAARLMRLFALAFELREDFFDDKIDRHVSALRVINYPDQPEAPLPGQLRAGEHSDFGSLTILLQEDRPGGLQVRDPSGEWVDVAATPDSFVVNIGDLMQMWTNDRWVSTLHRVVNPPSERAASSRRQSIVFFHQPNHDALIECLPGCAGPGNPAKHRPVTSGEHMMMKVAEATQAAS